MPHKKRKENTKISLKHNRYPYGAPLNTLRKGSITIETALTLPLFLFAIVSALFLFRVLQIQYMVENSLEKAAARTAVLGEEQPFQTEQKMKSLFYQYLIEQNCPFHYLFLGMAGFSWEESCVDDAYLDLKVSYRVNTPLSALGRRAWNISSQVKMRRWNGYDLQNGAGAYGVWVYVTPNGKVYHRDRNCTHLKLSIMYVPWSGISSEHCAACQLCAAGQNTALLSMVYITREGDCYHFKLDCAGLKRTIFMIPIEQAQGKSPCSRCGGR